MLMNGSSIARDTEHGRAVTAQLTRRHGTLEEAIDAGMFALSAAGLTRGIRRQARAACEDYFYNRLGLAPGYEPPPLRAIPAGLEPLSNKMTKVLEDGPRLKEHPVHGARRSRTRPSAKAAPEGGGSGQDVLQRRREPLARLLELALDVQARRAGLGPQVEEVDPARRL